MPILPNPWAAHKTRMGACILGIVLALAQVLAEQADRFLPLSGRAECGSVSVFGRRRSSPIQARLLGSHVVSQTTHAKESNGYEPLGECDPRCQKVLRAARRLVSQQADWVAFFRRVLGPRGIVRRTFPSRREQHQFEQTETYAEIQRLLATLREREPASVGEQEPTRVITVRLPRSVHEALRLEAHQHFTSMNKLCISKLLQFIESELVPNERFRLGEPSGLASRKRTPARGPEEGE